MTVRKTTPAANDTPRKKRVWNSCLVSLSLRYCKKAYACRRAKTPAETQKHTPTHTQHGSRSYEFHLLSRVQFFSLKYLMLTCCSHVLTRPYRLEAHKRDLHGQHQAHYIKCAISCVEENKKKQKLRYTVQTYQNRYVHTWVKV